LFSQFFSDDAAKDTISSDTLIILPTVGSDIAAVRERRRRRREEEAAAAI
jgi:hypothetical protein